MTLKVAYENWSLAPRNMVLARKYRDAVQKVLLKMHADKELSVFTTSFVKELFARCDEPREFKAQACSVLMWILCWGGDHGYCERPDFDLSVANQPEQELQADPMEETKTEDDMEENLNRGRAPRPVAQIDPKTLGVIKIWSGITTAAKELGIQNIDRAIMRHGLAGGFFWCDKNDVDGFQPGTRAERKLKKARNAKAKVKEKAAETPHRMDDVPHVENCPMQECISIATAEMPTIKATVVSCPDELLKYTDEELKNALYIKGWRGQLTKTCVMNL